MAERNLLKTSKGLLRLDAKPSYKEGFAVLSVYGFAMDKQFINQVNRVLLERIRVPRDTPTQEKADILLALCDVVAVRNECGYALRSKLKGANRGKQV